MSLTALISDAWMQAMRESPSPYGGGYLAEWLGGPRTTYRQRLDAQPHNVYGELIPRIVIVRRNLARLRKPGRAPRLP